MPEGSSEGCGKWREHVTGEPDIKPRDKGLYLCRCGSLTRPGVVELKVRQARLCSNGSVAWVGGMRPFSADDVIKAWFDPATPPADQATCAILLCDGQRIEKAVYTSAGYWSYPFPDPNVAGELKVEHRRVLMYAENLRNLAKLAVKEL